MSIITACFSAPSPITSNKGIIRLSFQIGCSKISNYQHCKTATFLSRLTDQARPQALSPVRKRGQAVTAVRKSAASSSFLFPVPVLRSLPSDFSCLWVSGYDGFHEPAFKMAGEAKKFDVVVVGSCMTDLVRLA